MMHLELLALVVRTQSNRGASQRLCRSGAIESFARR